MIKLNVCLLFLGLCSITVLAQKKEVTISGQVFDKEDLQPLEYATISFYKLNENTIVSGGITNNKGVYSIQVPVGIYNIHIEYISYTPFILSNKVIKQNQNLGEIFLDINPEALEDVEIIAQTTTVNLKLDKKVYTVGKDATISGGTISDVLDNVPSVAVDVEGNVSLRGNENVKILINGKPSGLVGLNSTEALRLLPAESIEKVEVVTSPSARYDAEGTAGIINIILRRSKLLGLNGVVTTNVGYPLTTSASGTLNYRTGDFNFFTTSGVSYREIPGNANTTTEYFDEIDPSIFINEKRKFDREREGYNIDLGLEWYLDPNTSVISSILFKNSDNFSNTTNNIKEINDFGELVSESIRRDPEFEDDKTLQYSLNFDKNFDSEGHQLLLMFQYENNSETENSEISQDGNDTEKVQTLEDQDRLLIQSDYVYPIKEHSQLEGGYRGSFSTLDTDYSVLFNENGLFILDTNLSNNLVYKENVNAFYAQYGSKIKDSFSYLLGLRMEQTAITINQIESNSKDNKNYMGLFPTVNLTYELSEEQSFSLGYNRRISRPRSRFINPFPSRSSATNLFQGNPDLNPSYSNQIELSYLNQLEKLTLNSSLYFSHATSVFTFIGEDTGDTVLLNGAEVAVIRRSPINLSTNNRYGIEFTTSYRHSKKWSINGNLNLFQSITKGNYNSVNYDAENLSWLARLNARVLLPFGINCQTQMRYQGPSEDSQNKRKGMFSSNLAFSKDIVKDKATLTFNVSDIFNTRKYRIETTTETFFSQHEYQWRERSFNMSFTYRINQKNKPNKKRRNSNTNYDENFGG